MYQTSNFQLGIYMIFLAFHHQNVTAQSLFKISD